MDVGFIERLIALMERSRLTELEYSEGGSRLRLGRDAPPASSTAASASPKPADAQPGSASADAPTRPEALSDRPPEARDHLVTAGMLGTFYRAPGPGLAPFVSEGDLVQEGQTLAILEAMKVLNPVEADRGGRILRILVEDGGSVEAGTPLFTMTSPG